MADADHPPTNNEPIEIAMEAVAGHAPPGGIAHTLLERQVRLVNAEIAQLRRKSWRDYSLIGLVALLLFGVGSFIYSASKADGVVIEAFAVPPGLERRGLTGTTVAQHLLDELSTLQAETVSIRASSSYANSWGDEIAVEVPYANISLGEFRRMLRRWLGDQTRLSGEVVRLVDGGIAVRARVGTAPPSRFEGTETELDDLIRKSAEAIYGETQPYRYGVWLRREGRVDEARTVFQTLMSGTDEGDRLWGYMGYGNTLLDDDATLDYYRAALRLRPDFAPAIANLAIGASGAGREEAAYRYFGQLLQHERAMRRQLEPGFADYPLLSARSVRSALTGDFAGAAVVDRVSLETDTSSANRAFTPVNLAVSLALAHDIAGARRALREAGLGTGAALSARLTDLGWAADPRPFLFQAIGEWATVRDLLTVNLARIGGAANDDSLFLEVSPLVRAQLAVAQARSGRVADAEATITGTPLDCDPCVRARGIVAAHGQRPELADRWFREAVRRTPSLPLAHGNWAEALLLRGHLKGAIEQARLANRKGPRWAEPLKTWGDALMRAGQPRDAAMRYRSAARLAPQWGALHIAWGEALTTFNEKRAAEKYRAAERMHLSQADRARLRQRLAATP